MLGIGVGGSVARVVVAAVVAAVVVSAVVAVVEGVVAAVGFGVGFGVEVGVAAAIVSAVVARVVSDTAVSVCSLVSIPSVALVVASPSVVSMSAEVPRTAFVFSSALSSGKINRKRSRRSKTIPALVPPIHAFLCRLIYEVGSVLKFRTV